VRLAGRRNLIWVVFQKVFPGHGFSFEDCLNLWDNLIVSKSA
jgi:hypothetical protein